MFKPGEKYILKLTAEPVIILAVEGDEVTVRRPKTGESGTEYVVDKFNSFELTTLEETRAEFLANVQKDAEVNAEAKRLREGDSPKDVVVKPN